MKINCGLSPTTKAKRRDEFCERWYRDLTEWHPYFAIWPRRVGDNDCRWLERIEARLVPWYSLERLRNYYEYGYPRMEFEYRAPQGKPAAQETK